MLDILRYGVSLSPATRRVRGAELARQNRLRCLVFFGSLNMFDGGTVPRSVVERTLYLVRVRKGRSEVSNFIEPSPSDSNNGTFLSHRHPHSTTPLSTPLVAMPCL